MAGRVMRKRFRLASPGAGVDDLREGTLSYSVGAGITVASDPASEWQETLDKAALIQSLANPQGAAREPA